jgi:DNA-binding LacI/PurR family transcriptional regulator
MKKYSVDILIALITGAIITVISEVTNSTLLNEVISIKSIIWLLFFFIIFSISLYHFSKQKYIRKRKIFVITSSFTTAPFYTELIKNIIYKLESNNYDIDLKIPQEDFIFSEIEKHLNNLSKFTDYYEGGIIIHSDIDENFSVLQKFAKKFKKPIVFVDSKNTSLVNDFTDNCSFVGFNNEKTGNLAADYCGKLLRKRNIDTPKVLVLASKQQTKRQENFISKMNKSFTSIEIEINDNVGFDRRRSYKTVYEKLKELRLNKEKVFDLVFATNDEMAIGCIQAISDVGTKEANNIQIIGVDGIQEAKDMIDKNDILFMNTVNQSPKILAEESVQLLFRKLKNHNSLKIKMLNPEMYI